MGRTTHPRDMSPEMRAVQLKNGLLCTICRGLGVTRLSHGSLFAPTEKPCIGCGGTGRKKAV